MRFQQTLNFALVPWVLVLVLAFANGYAQGTTATNSAQVDSYLPEGEGRELLKVLCTSCHDLRVVIPQRKNSETWQQTAKGMLTVWDPRYSEYLGDDVETLVRYLAQYFGPLSPPYKTLQSNSELREKYLRGEIKSLININTASLDELMRLPGVSKNTAEMIVKYREAHGSFKSSGDLKTIEGIGDKEFEKLRVLITVD